MHQLKKGFYKARSTFNAQRLSPESANSDIPKGFHHSIRRVSAG
jgi:hypothetical protein